MRCWIPSPSSVLLLQNLAFTWLCSQRRLLLAFLRDKWASWMIRQPRWYNRVWCVTLGPCLFPTFFRMVGALCDNLGCATFQSWFFFYLTTVNFFLYRNNTVHERYIYIYIYIYIYMRISIAYVTLKLYSKRMYRGQFFSTSLAPYPEKKPKSASHVTTIHIPTTAPRAQFHNSLTWFTMHN